MNTVWCILRSLISLEETFRGASETSLERDSLERSRLALYWIEQYLPALLRAIIDDSEVRQIVSTIQDLARPEADFTTPPLMHPARRWSPARWQICIICYRRPVCLGSRPGAEVRVHQARVVSHHHHHPAPLRFSRSNGIPAFEMVPFGSVPP